MGASGKASLYVLEFCSMSRFCLSMVDSCGRAVPIAVTCFCRKKFPLNSKLLFVSIMLMRSQTVSVGGVLEVHSSRCNLAAWIPSVRGMLVYNTLVLQTFVKK